MERSFSSKLIKKDKNQYIECGWSDSNPIIFICGLKFKYWHLLFEMLVRLVQKWKLNNKARISKLNPCLNVQRTNVNCTTYSNVKVYICTELTINTPVAREGRGDASCTRGIGVAVEECKVSVDQVGSVCYSHSKLGREMTFSGWYHR